MEQNLKEKIFKTKPLKIQNKKYQILLEHQLGQGGAGKVYPIVQQDKDSISLVVKIMPLEQGKKSKIIQAELQTFRKINSLNCNYLLKCEPQYITSDNNFYILMEKCQKSLETILSQKQKLKQKQVLRLLYEIVQAYSCLYKQGILHMDIKPGNILYKQGHFKLADYGLASLLQSSQQLQKGTFIYMPLQRMQQGYKPCVQSDVFSIGIVIYQCLQGKHPFFKSYEDKLQYYRYMKSFKLPNLNTYYSVKMRPFLQNLYSMLKLNKKQRLPFYQLQEFINKHKLFQQFRSQKIIFTQYKKQQQVFHYDQIQFTKAIKLNYIDYPQSIQQLHNIQQQKQVLQQEQVSQQEQVLQQKIKSLNNLNNQQQKSKQELFLINRQKIIVYFYDVANKLFKKKLEGLSQQGQAYCKKALDLIYLLGFSIIDRSLNDESPFPFMKDWVSSHYCSQIIKTFKFWYEQFQNQCFKQYHSIKQRKISQLSQQLLKILIKMMKSKDSFFTLNQNIHQHKQTEILFEVKKTITILSNNVWNEMLDMKFDGLQQKQFTLKQIQKWLQQLDARFFIQLQQQ